MDWAGDLKSVLTKGTAKKGRRANANASSKSNPLLSPDQTESSSTNKEAGTPSSSLEQVPPVSKKYGGWAEETQKSGKSKPGPNIIEQERFQISNSSPLSDDDIPIIPDLDDIQDDILLNDIAQAPSLSINRVATYKELNSDLMKLGAMASLEDVDLSILSKCIQYESTAEEPDEVWTWEQLFTATSAEINSNKPVDIVPFVE